MNPESVDVTAGLGGFLAFFLLALALYFLMRNMNARLRRMSYREELEAREDKDDPDADKPDSAGRKAGPGEAPDLG